ncbi:MAG: Gfo/Idh/MocA family oxidoreductase [Candidatus Acidiferrum sp.]
MANDPSYIIVGKGCWGTRMHALLEGEGRRVEFAPSSRHKAGESDPDYEARVIRSFAGSSTQIAWLCVPPGAHVPLLMRAALAAGLHMIVEKPWTYSREETEALQRAAETKNLKIGVHFEYCFLSDVERWRREYARQVDLRFSGIFTTSLSDHMGVSAMQNLGSHLFSILEYAIPDATVGEIRCGYDAANQRTVWLESGKQSVDEIDLLAHKEPIIQRYLASFENSLDGEKFPIDLEFAQRVNEKLELLVSGTTSPPANAAGGAPGGDSK